MSDTYKAWNNKEYPSPPPDGWYEASDGLWWAPNSGPGPKKLAASPSDAGTQVAGPSPATDEAQPFSQPKQPQPFGHTPQPFGQPKQPPQKPQPFSQPKQPQPFGHTPQTQPFNQQSKRSSKTTLNLLVAGGVSGLLCIVATGFFAIRQGNEEVTSTTPAPTISTTSAPGTTEPSTTQPPTTEPSTTTADQEISTTVPIEEARTQFEAFLTGEDMVGIEALKLDQIGSSNCTRAAITPDKIDWDRYIDEQALGLMATQASNPPEAGLPLTDSQIRSIYNGSIVFYCPDEAGRLGVTV